VNPRHDACWLTLHRAHISSQTIVALLEHFGTVENIFTASRAQLAKCLAQEKPAVDAILAGINEDSLEKDFRWLGEKNNHLLTWQDAEYPRLLREIPDPPVVLFVCGDKTLLNQPQIAIVGSRNPTRSGQENARAFASYLAQAGLGITSGLAIGIDACAHRGALESGGKTIAVFGTGLDRVYPARHRELAHQIASQGALISEFPLGSPPRREHFPRRNRIISGISLGALVVEAALQSGSLITARLAADQGREVFAIPGSIHSPLARGCHALIRQGAKLVETAQDILEELAPLAHSLKPAAVEISGAHPHDEQTAKLLEHLGYDPVDIDTLVERSGLTPDFISSMLLQMELHGLIEARPGGKYLRIS
jgi:DNA processing protein